MSPPSALTVLHDSDGVVALAKPAGLPVVPTRGDPDGPTVRRLAESQLGAALWVVHRLDRETSGVLLLARSAEVHRTLCEAFAGRRAQKTYLAVCRRRGDAPTAGRVDRPLRAGRRGTRLVEPGAPGAREAVTRYRVMALAGLLAVVEARPETGRTHQVRVHLAAAGWPLAVDPRYGEAGPVEAGGHRCERLTLHASRLRLPELGLDLACEPDDALARVVAAILHSSAPGDREHD